MDGLELFQLPDGACNTANTEQGRHHPVWQSWPQWTLSGAYHTVLPDRLLNVSRLGISLYMQLVLRLSLSIA